MCNGAIANTASYVDGDFSSFGMQRTSEKMNLTLPNLISDDYLLSAEIETSGTVTKFANYAGFNAYSL